MTRTPQAPQATPHKQAPFAHHRRAVSSAQWNWQTRQATARNQRLSGQGQPLASRPAIRKIGQGSCGGFSLNHGDKPLTRFNSPRKGGVNIAANFIPQEPLLEAPDAIRVVLPVGLVDVADVNAFVVHDGLLWLHSNHTTKLYNMQGVFA